jgi:hypothetical protein
MMRGEQMKRGEVFCVTTRCSVLQPDVLCYNPMFCVTTLLTFLQDGGIFAIADP